ncbi:MAG: enoyl-CoA hydratase-related protein [Bacteriovoracaceae bacterium]
MLNLQIDERGVATISLNRPELHNAFNDELIEKLTKTVSEVDDKKEVRLIVLTGEGASFCAGADLNWMKKMKNYSEEENYQDSLKLSNMFWTINSCKKPVIGKINGHALGGGVGIVSCCDYVIASKEALLGLTEVRLGLVPAVISPFVINKMGESFSRAYFMSGERFSADKAMTMGLVHDVCESAHLNDTTEKVIKSFLMAGPEAAITAKALIFKNKELGMGKNIQEYTCRTIAKIRTGAEGQEGMGAMLEKRKANWIKV